MGLGGGGGGVWQHVISGPLLSEASKLLVNKDLPLGSTASSCVISTDHSHRVAPKCGNKWHLLSEANIVLVNKDLPLGSTASSCLIVTDHCPLTQSSP